MNFIGRTNLAKFLIYAIIWAFSAFQCSSNPFAPYVVLKPANQYIIKGKKSEVEKQIQKAYEEYNGYYAVHLFHANYLHIIGENKKASDQFEKARTIYAYEYLDSFKSKSGPRHWILAKRTEVPAEITSSRISTRPASGAPTSVPPSPWSLASLRLKQ